MHVRHVKIRRSSRHLTIVSLINKVSEVFLKSYKQNGGRNRKGFNHEKRPKPIWEDTKINFGTYKIFYIILKP